MKTQNEIEIPSIVKYFFCKAFPPKETPEGFVYVGLNTDMEFDNLAWNTKIKILDEEREGTQEPSGKYHIFVSAQEVIEYIMSSGVRFSSLKPCEMYDVENYVKLSGLNIIRNIKTKPEKIKTEKKQREKRQTIKSVHEKEGSLDLGPVSEKNTEDKNIQNQVDPDIKVVRDVIIEFTGKQILKSLSGEEISLEPGKYVFALINSPNKHDEGRFQWLVLKEYLPKIFGKSVISWHMMLGYSPLD